MTMQNVQAAPSAPGAPATPAPLEAPTAVAPAQVWSSIPEGGGRLIIDKEGDRTIITTTELPPSVMPLVTMAKDTALGLGILLAVIVILGPFARMIARRMERRPEVKAAADHADRLQHQIEQLQQSIDAMSVEVERISESQRFQSKLIYERKPESSIPS